MAVVRNRRTADRKAGARPADGGETGEGSRDGMRVTRKQLVDLLNEDLAREYQAVIAYVVYSQVLKGAE
jgi:bacterioferritin